MKKIMTISILIFSLTNIHADEFVWGEDFKDGDTISAEVFNQIFNTIEKINRTVVDEDLTGSWNCDAITTRSTANWVDKGSFYLLENAQINFNSTSSNPSIDNPYNVTSSNPSPLKRADSAFNGTYQLYKNMLFIKENGDSNSRIYSVDIVSNTRIELTFLETSATSFPANYSSFIVCDTTAIIPSPPSNMTIAQNGSSVTIGWTDNSNDETGFKIYRKKGTDESYSFITSVDQDIVSYTDSDVSDGETYFYYLTSYNDNGESRTSNPVDISVDSTPPSVASTDPENNETVSRQFRNIIATFSEKVELVCPDGDQYSSMDCPSSSYAISFTALIEGSSREVGFSNVTLGSGGQNTITMSTMGSAERFDANQNDIIVTINKDWIRDLNGVQMNQNFQFKFNVDDSLDNPSCPPSC
jgi:hypothetical protein